MLANKIEVLTNRSAFIDAEGSIDVAAKIVNNSRTTIETEQGIPQISTKTQVLWTAGMPREKLLQYASRRFPQWRWPRQNADIKAEVVNAFRAPVTVTVPKHHVTNLDGETRTFTLLEPIIDTFWGKAERRLVHRDLGVSGPQQYESITDTGDAYVLNFWPDYNPEVHIRPDQVKIRRDLGEDGRDYNEIKRVVTKTLVTDRLARATPAALIRAQGDIRINSDGGEINNLSSVMSAGGQLIRHAPAGAIRDVGLVLRQSVSETTDSTFYWHQKTGHDQDTRVVPNPDPVHRDETVDALPAIARGNDGVRGVARKITIGSVDRVGETVESHAVSGNTINTRRIRDVVGSRRHSTRVEDAEFGAVARATNAPGEGHAATGADDGAFVPVTADGVTRVMGATADANEHQTDDDMAAGVGNTGLLTDFTRASTGDRSRGSTRAPSVTATARPGLQTLGDGAVAIPTLALPQNGLYSLHPEPERPQLIQTDERFTRYKAFLSSDYMLKALNLDPQKIQKRIGDGFYEAKLVRDQLTQLTGRARLPGYQDNVAEYTGLMTNGVAHAKSFGLVPGVALRDDQMRQLTTDMVWLVSQDVTLPDGGVTSVLVPKLYLAQASTVDLTHTGALVAGREVALEASGEFNNAGQIVGDFATQILGERVMNHGDIGGGGDTTLHANEDVRNHGGQIYGKRVVIQAGRDIVHGSTTLSKSRDVEDWGMIARVTSSGVGATGSISADEGVTLLGGRDVNVSAANIDGAGETIIGAGRDVTVGGVTLSSSQEVSTRGGQSGGTDSETHHVGSQISGDAGVSVVAGGNVSVQGSTMSSEKNIELLAENNVTVAGVKDTHTKNDRSLGGSGAEHKNSSYDERVKGSVLNAQGGVLVAAGQDDRAADWLSKKGVDVVPLVTGPESVVKSGIESGVESTGAERVPKTGGNVTIHGSSITTGTQTQDGRQTGGDVTMIARGDIDVSAMDEQHESHRWSKNTRKGFLSSERTTQTRDAEETRVIASTVSGKTVGAGAGADITVTGSTIVGTDDVALFAKNDVKIGASEERSHVEETFEQIKTGLGSTGTGISFGRQEQKDQSKDDIVKSVGSVIGSTDGNVKIRAEKDVTITGSDLLAKKDVLGIGRNVTVESAEGSVSHAESHEMNKSGVTLGVAGQAVDAIKGLVAQSQAMAGAKDGRVAALRGIAAAGSLASVADIGDAVMKGGVPDVKVELSFGSQSSKQTFTNDQTRHTGSKVKALGTATFVAEGDDANRASTENGTGASTKNGNVTIAGSTVEAGNVSLVAKNAVNLLDSTDTDVARSKNESKSASLGVSYGTKGFGVSGAMSRAKGHANVDGETRNNTHITATDKVTIQSGGDTNIAGAVVKGKRVEGIIGGDLNIASTQDTMESEAEQKSAGGGFDISQGGGSASVSMQNASASGSYAGVREQSGIQAGTEGFDLDVKGNTDLKGAYISGEADASKNSLKTGTLTYSDIDNHSTYEADSMGISAGFSVGAPDKDTGARSVRNAGGVVPLMMQSESGDERAQTRSAVSAGTIMLSKPEDQKQELALLNRDTENLNGAVSKTPDLVEILGGQADLMDAVSAAAQTVATQIGSYADRKARDAAERGDAEGVKEWSEGGNKRAAMHAAGSALIGGLGGGGVAGAAGAAAGAGLASKLGGTLNELSRGIAERGLTGDADVDATIGNIVANAVAVGVGATVGGNAGAVGAYAVDLYNRSSSVEEQEKINEIAGESEGKKARLVAAACAMTKCYAEYEEGSAAYNYLKNISDFGASEQLVAERQTLSQQEGLFGYTKSGLLSDENKDAAKQWNNAYQFTTRGIGVVQTAGGTLGVAGSVLTARASCATGVGCVANIVVAGLSVDAMFAGSKQAISGKSESTYLNQALTGLGMSADAANLLEAAVSVGAAAKVGAVANAVTDSATVLNKLGTASYSKFSTSGVKITSEIEASPQMLALVAEVRKGSPQLKLEAAREFAAEYIKSGKALPRKSIVAPGSALVKVVPKGEGVSPYSGYWMSPKQAREIAVMQPEEAVRILGLPAAQAAKIQKNGLDFYAITPSPGATPTVFVSNVAGTSQGLVVMPGGAQQVLVPNRSQWTNPNAVNPFDLQ
jgi:filamentous hemagglutinin